MSEPAETVVIPLKASAPARAMAPAPIFTSSRRPAPAPLPPVPESVMTPLKVELPPFTPMNSFSVETEEPLKAAVLPKVFRTVPLPVSLLT